MAARKEKKRVSSSIQSHLRYVTTHLKRGWLGPADGWDDVDLIAFSAVFYDGRFSLEWEIKSQSQMNKGMLRIGTGSVRVPFPPKVVVVVVVERNVTTS